MKRFLSVKIILCLMVLTLVSFSVFGQEFSLDNNPTNPIVRQPNVPPFKSAEDEFGLNLPATIAGLIGPSLSLWNGPLLDSDILTAGPAFFTSLPGFSYVDSLSSDHNPNNTPSIHLTNPWIGLRFSIDRATGGINPTDPTYMQASSLSQAADIFQGSVAFQHPGFFCPAPPPIAPPFGRLLAPFGSAPNSTNIQLYNNTFFGLIRPLDNIDAYNELPSFTNSSTPAYFYFTPHHAEFALSGFSGADLLVKQPNGTIVLYAPAAVMGLDIYGGPFSDSIDALVLWDNDNNPALFSQDVDYALFSLAPGSATLAQLQMMGLPVDGGTVFFTSFNGCFYLYTCSADVSIGPNPSPPLPGNPNDTNIDALEIW